MKLVPLPGLPELIFLPLICSMSVIPLFSGRPPAAGWDT
jgi:hypothetical protein